MSTIIDNTEAFLKTFKVKAKNNNNNKIVGVKDCMHIRA